ncbi:MAG: hemerythrin domain-containing protein, partial [Armatimonadota bacterium]|nr:hemerythrin domain-containing protein [Armatimonadota bacterium]
MKRHPALRDLSDDHHLGLVHAHRLIKAAVPGTPDRGPTIQNFLNFWESHMSLHFEAEEDALLPVALRHGFLACSSPLDQMLVQHARIRG